MRHKTTLFLALTILLSSSCLIKPPEEIPDPWKAVFQNELQHPIRNMHNGIASFYVITDEEFIRLDNNNEIVEFRNIGLPLRFFGRPSLSENVFIRTVRPDTSQAIEFHLTKVPDEKVVIRLDDLEAQTGDLLGLIDKGRYTSAFNSDGSQILIPFENNSKNIYTLGLFDIKLNGTNSAFESIELVHAVDVPEQPVDPDGLNNVIFVGGNYYVTSTNGVTRLTPQGDAQLVERQWLFDIFRTNNKMYGTGAGGGLFVSEDNGLSWERENDNDKPSKVFYIEQVNDQIFTQRFTGDPFSLADDNFLGITKIRLNKAFDENGLGDYNNIRYFFSNYYLAVQKQLYSSKSLELDE